MKGAVLYGPKDIRFEDCDDPRIIEPTDAVLRLRPPACAGRISGRTAAYNPSTGRHTWGMSIAALSKKSAAPSNP